MIDNNLLFGRNRAEVRKTGAMTLAALQVHETNDAAAFWPVIQPLIAAKPILCSVLASNTARCRDLAGGSPGARWYWVTQEERIIAAAMHIPPHGLHLPDGGPLVADALARHLLASHYPLSSVGGERFTVEAFSSAWIGLGGAASRTVRTNEAIYYLAELLPNPRPAGSLHYATSADVDLVDHWCFNFEQEALGRHFPGRNPQDLIHERRLALWQVDGRPVSMAGTSRPFNRVARISWVFTPTEQRGNGYATAVVTGLSRDQQAIGNRCVLYANLANCTSNAIYWAIGYRRMAEAVEIDFS